MTVAVLCKEPCGLMLTFRANPQHLVRIWVAAPEEKLGEKLGVKLGIKLGETRAVIVEAMRDDPKVTITQLAQTLNISTTAVERNIKYLKAHGYVKRVGPAKGGHWEILQ